LYIQSDSDQIIAKALTVICIQATEVVVVSFDISFREFLHDIGTYAKYTEKALMRYARCIVQY
jgi:hypothetical protein